MSPIQLENLRNDVAEFKQYIQEVEQTGNLTLVEKLRRKERFMEKQLQSVIA